MFAVVYNILENRATEFFFFQANEWKFLEDVLSIFLEG